MTRLAFVALLALGTAWAGEPASVGGGSSRIFFLDIRGGRVLSANPDGTDLKVLVDGRRKGPDGIVVDPAAGYVYWSNMGKAALDDGSIDRAKVDGSEVTTIVPEGGTFTAKQMKLDKKHGKLYWSDREGMRVQRANLDGSHVETLIETGHGDDERKDQSR
jgi:sugar lactone lactonase YvrE